MPQALPASAPVFLLLFCGYALAQIRYWPSAVYVALSNGTVFVDFHCDRNVTDGSMTISLVDTEANTTVASRPVPGNQSEGTVEFNCTCFPYAGRFRFWLQLGGQKGCLNDTQWWSEVLHVQWPPFHIGVQRTSNRSSSSFQIGISTNFEPCRLNLSPVYLEVSYFEHNTIGKVSIDKVKAQVRRDVAVVKSQWVDLGCVFPFTERDFIKVALKSRHADWDIKSSGPLYLSQIFTYKLLIDNVYKLGCERTVTVRLLPPPCAFAQGKVVLYREGVTGSGEDSPPVASKWLSHGENETEFNCSLFEPGKNKYCFKFILNFSRLPSHAQSCIVVQRNTESWGRWQTWSPCSVNCGEGVRQRYRECLVPSTGMAHCTGLQKELSPCSLEDCTVVAVSPSLAPVHPESKKMGNMVAVAGISICLVVIVATVLITLWRKLCRTPKCNSVRRRSSLHSPGFRKNSDEVNIYCQSQQRHSFSESLEALPEQAEEVFDKLTVGRRHSHPLSAELSNPTSGESLSPNVQKIIPPIFGYRLAQQQLKEMKKKGLKEATKVYHVSQNPQNDTVLDATSVIMPEQPESQEEAALSRFRIKAPFLEPKSSVSPERPSPKVDFVLSQLSELPLSSQPSVHQRTEEWVEMVERGYMRNPHFKRTASFHETKHPRPFRERSLSSCTTRQLAFSGSRLRGFDQHQEKEDRRPKSRMGDGEEERHRFWNERLSANRPDLLGDRRLGTWSTGLDKTVQSRARRGPSPIQRNMMARKLKQANSSATYSHQRNTSLSPSQYRRDKCKSLPLDSEYGLYPSSPYGLTESEQRMMDLSGFFGEEDENRDFEC
ncbi:thrombospondin type-1 domain-containing protein 1 isoform X1 [Lepisosteus oculatus]|uniref:thrombospondin type-1 domain-containing protein 1 isoform X1 n=1 Tax=Lepisosteus oculatus TaxID=7918 RepID=UPI00371391E9